MCLYVKLGDKVESQNGKNVHMCTCIHISYIYVSDCISCCM